MTLEEALYSVLGSDALVSGLVGTRIYPDIAPRAVSKPYLIWQESAGMPTNDLDGSGGLTDYNVEISVYATDDTQAMNAIARVVSAMEAATGGSSPPSFIATVIAPGTQTVGFDPDTRLYGARSHFRVSLTPS